MSRLSYIESLRTERPELYDEFVAYVQDHTYEEVAEAFADRFGMDASQLNARLPVWNRQFGLRKPKVLEPPAGNKPGEKDLTDEEKEFLRKFQNGEISFEQAQHQLAYRVLEKILRNPDLLKVADWLKSEVIKIKREELSMKKEYMERSWGMLFGGFLIPKLCPKCGHDLQPKVAMPLENKELKVLEEGEVIEHEKEPVGITASVS